MAKAAGPPTFVASIVVDAPPARVMQAFFSHTDLAYWWEAERSVAVPRPSGVYAVTWRTTELRDDVLGQLGGTLQGTVLDYDDSRSLFLADVYWQPPASDPLGPMAIEVTCRAESIVDKTTVTVRQSASEDGPRWRRYFEISEQGWTSALATLKDYIENEWLYRVRTIKQQPRT